LSAMIDASGSVVSVLYILWYKMKQWI